MFLYKSTKTFIANVTKKFKLISTSLVLILLCVSDIICVAPPTAQEKNCGEQLYYTRLMFVLVLL